MRYFITTALFCLILVSPSFAYFNCSSETTSFNSTSGLWAAEFIDCPVMPQLVTFQNITVVNQTNITIVQNITNVTSFDCTDLQGFLTNSTATIYNVTQLYGDCREQKNIVVEQLNAANNEITNCNAQKVDRDTYNICAGNLTYMTMQASQKESDGNLHTIIAFIAGIGIVWFVKLRKPDNERSRIVRPQGETQFNPNAIEKDSRMARLEARLDDSVNEIRDLVAKKGSRDKPVPARKKR